jgi:predicted nucleic acid-binding protein
VVFDVNVFVSALLGADSTWPLLGAVPPSTENAAADCLSLAFDGERFALFTSLHILSNFRRVLREAGWGEGIADEAVEAMSEIVTMSGGMVLDPPRTVFDIDDHEDNLILDCAVACDAWLVVSDDTDLTLASPWRQRVAILRPHEFVSRLLHSR